MAPEVAELKIDNVTASTVEVTIKGADAASRSGKL